MIDSPINPRTEDTRGNPPPPMPTAAVRHRQQRDGAERGAIAGLVSGWAGGVAFAVITASGVLLHSLYIPEAIIVLATVGIVGSLVGVATGAAIGAIVGLLLAANDAERHAPLVGTGIGLLVGVGLAGLMLLDGLNLVNVLGIAVVLAVFTFIGNLGGRMFVQIQMGGRR